jgi:ketosteroid isomerase-like protein
LNNQEGAIMKRFTMSTSTQGLICAVAAACAFAVLFSALPTLASDMDANAKALIKLDDDWSKAAAARDVDKVASFYADDAIAYPPNEPAAKGREAAKKVWAAYFAEPTFKISWKTNHAEVAKSGDIGFTSGTYEDSFKGPDGKMVSEKGKYVCMWKKQEDGSWKAIHDIWNSDAK